MSRNWQSTFHDPEARGEPIDQADRTIHFPQQQRLGIRRHCAAIVRGSGRRTRQHCLHPAATKPFEIELLRDTLCRQRTL